MFRSQPAADSADLLADALSTAGAIHVAPREISERCLAARADAELQLCAADLDTEVSHFLCCR
jgi:hypothetical protein